jgi:hypothetical protein
VLSGKPYKAGSMEPYKYEVFQQCFAATEAWNCALGRLESTPNGGPEQFILAALGIVSDLQGFAVAVGILSDLFFPSGSGSQSRGRELCRLYGVTKGTSRLENANVQVRHALVHIDRDLDHWLEGQVGRLVGPVTIEPWEGPVPPLSTTRHARIIDNKYWRLMVLGKVLELKPLLMEVGKVSQVFPLEFQSASGRVRISISPPSA